MKWIWTKGTLILNSFNSEKESTTGLWLYDSVTIGSNLTGPHLQSLDINSHGESLNMDWIFN